MTFSVPKQAKRTPGLDEDRENEGDLVMAAGHATPEALAFSVRHTSGRGHTEAAVELIAAFVPESVVAR